MSLPTVLVGPMLRRCTPAEVSVFVVTTRACEVSLTAFDSGGQAVLSGTRATLEVSPGLHAVVVTAADGPGLSWGAQASYAIAIDGQDAELPAGLLYDGEVRLSFTLPPEAASELVMWHGSCRKPHGRGRDALAALDRRLAARRAAGEAVPHLLLLTGDQIYADDVHPDIFSAVRSLQNTLGVDDPELKRLPAELRDAPRGKALKTRARLTSGAADHHLLTRAEFAGHYAVVWSDTVPVDSNAEALADFVSGRGQVRRLLAHVPTLMIFDDHEVTDDWYRTGQWKEDVLATPVGRRLVRNALTTYAVFQHWGTVPVDFDTAGTPASRILDGIAQDKPQVLNSVFGIPRQTAGTIRWDWHLGLADAEVVALDCRTRRDASQSKTAPAGLARKVDYERHFQAVAPALSVVLSPTPVLGRKAQERVQAAARFVSKMPGFGWLANALDVEAWSFHDDAFKELVGFLRKRTAAVVLSGDVHYGFTAQLKKGNGHRWVNLTSSAFHNQWVDNPRWLLAGRGALEAAGGLPSVDDTHELDDGTWRETVLLFESSEGVAAERALDEAAFRAEVENLPASDRPVGLEAAHTIEGEFLLYCHAAEVRFKVGRVLHSLLRETKAGVPVSETASVKLPVG